jgi:hypothetical protein
MPLPLSSVSGENEYLYVKIISCFAAAILLGAGSSHAEPQSFAHGQLAVLRAGDGALNLHLKQAPVFVDQFDPTRFNEGPSLTVAIPTNGPNALFFNGHAATEGNLTRSADGRWLAFAGYAGVNLLQYKGVPSQLGIPRGFGTLGASAASFHLVYLSTNWYEASNPRGVVTDGAGNFWGCGSTFGTLFYNAQTAPAPVEFKTLLNTRAIRIINQVLYATLNAADGLDTEDSAGIYNYVNGSAPVALPLSPGVTMNLVVPTAPAYKKTCGFDLNPAGTIAYMADTQAGIQKYMKTGGEWKFAYNFAIPQVIPDAVNNGRGCFGLTVDFSGATPIIYATTTEGWDSMNSNRVVRIVDTNANAPVTTIAQSGSTNMVYRGVEFTPEPAPATAAK